MPFLICKRLFREGGSSENIKFPTTLADAADRKSRLALRCVCSAETGFVQLQRLPLQIIKVNWSICSSSCMG